MFAGITIGLSKTAVAVALLQLSSTRWHHRIIIWSAAVVDALMLLWSVLILAECPLVDSKEWDPETDSECFRQSVLAHFALASSGESLTCWWGQAA